jgi:hypothetical protein
VGFGHQNLVHGSQSKALHYAGVATYGMSYGHMLVQAGGRRNCVSICLAARHRNQQYSGGNSHM